MWVIWVLGGLAVWSVVAVLLALLIGKGISLADRPSSLAGATGPRTAVAARSRRRSVPLPPVGVALAALAVTLEAAGYAARLTGASGRVADVLSMDAPLSLPRMYVAALFGVAGLAALAGASRLPGRRAWWTAVGAVAGLVALVKGGGDVHTRVLGWLTEALSPTGALLVSGAVATGVLAGLWWLSRDERRDRRRVLGTLGGYAVAAVGLSAISSLVAGSAGGAATWAAAATFVEESGEALAGVSFLMAVLLGVAPRLVLPHEWALRRQADAHTLEVTERQPGRAAPGSLRP